MRSPIHLSRTSESRRATLRPWFPLLALTLCVCNGKQVDTGTTCPGWSGLSQQEHELQEDTPIYNVLWAPHDLWWMQQFRSFDSTTGEARVYVQVSESHNAFDMGSILISGEILGSCDESGFTRASQNIGWGIIDAFYRYKIDLETTTTWDPPILDVPADLEVGLSWEIESTQTTTGPNGVTVESEISERREVVELRAIETTLGEKYAMVVETSRGHRLYYVYGAGLVKGEALVRDGEVEFYGGD